jgi:hypothetical protein
LKLEKRIDLTELLLITVEQLKKTFEPIFQTFSIALGNGFRVSLPRYLPLFTAKPKKHFPTSRQEAE